MTLLEKKLSADLDLSLVTALRAVANTREAIRQCEGWKLVADGANLRIQQLEESIRVFRDGMRGAICPTCCEEIYKDETPGMTTLLDALGDPICLNCKQGECARHGKR